MVRVMVFNATFNDISCNYNYYTIITATAPQKEAKSMLLTHICITAHFHGLIQTLQ